MADQGTQDSPPPAPTFTKKKRQPVQFLPILLRYFKGVGALLAVWLAGYLCFSTVWVMLGLALYMLSNHYRKVKEAKKEFAYHAVTNEKEAILARTEELPSWVYFPDVERAEWLNKMIKKLWPYIGEYAKDLMRNSVEHQVNNSLPKSLRPFKFEKIDLGDLPVRVGGVKVYDAARRDEILMDVEIIYCSDSNIKVAVRGITSGIKDLQIHGIVRCQMKPLIKSMPLIGGINVFFLNNPTVSFDMTDMANILDMPLLSETLRKVVEDQIAAFMVLPNKLPITLAEGADLSSLKYSLPQGVLRLHIRGARELKAADFKVIGKGKSDPYCKVYVGAQSQKTKVIHDTIAPVWDEYFEFIVDQKHGQFADLEVFDEDPGDDDELGTASVDIQSVANKGTMDTWLPLEGVKTGMIHIRAIWLHLSKDPVDIQREEERRKIRISQNEHLAPDPAIQKKSKQAKEKGSELYLSSAILMVNLDSATSLPRSKKSMSEPSPKVVLYIGNDKQESLSKPRTTDPRWETNFQFLINDPEHQDLQVQVLDDGRNSKKLGNVVVPVKNVLKAPEMTINRPFALQESGHQSMITLRLCLRVLTSQMPAEWAQDKGEDIRQSPPATPATPAVEDLNANEPKPVPQQQEEVIPPEPEPEEPIPARPAFTSDDRQSDDSGTSRTPERQGSELRRRIPQEKPSLSDSDAGLGRIQVTIRYSAQRSRLIVVVHKCTNLIECDDEKNSDPYVRIYLLPDRSSSSKRKTQTIRNNLNPIYDETFEWTVSATEASSRTLEVSVKNSTGVFSKERTLMGQILIDLSQYDLTKAITEWYDLQDPNARQTTV